MRQRRGIVITVPERASIMLPYLLLDFNGTLTEDGVIPIHCAMVMKDRATTRIVVATSNTFAKRRGHSAGFWLKSM